MTYMALVDVRPAKPFEVLADGVWHAGQLEAWREQDGRWRGYVRWTIGVGMRHLGWVDRIACGRSNAGLA